MSEETNFDVLNGKLDLLIDSTTQLNLNQIKMFELLSERSKEVLKEDWSTKEHMEKDLKNAKKLILTPDTEFAKVSEHVSGVNLEDNAETKEEVEMDFTQVSVNAQTDKALLVVKKGYQQWLAKSLIIGGGSGYDNGNIYDIKILEISPKSGKSTKWVFKKWEIFKAVKNRQ